MLAWRCLAIKISGLVITRSWHVEARKPSCFALMLHGGLSCCEAWQVRLWFLVFALCVLVASCQIFMAAFKSSWGILSQMCGLRIHSAITTQKSCPLTGMSKWLFLAQTEPVSAFVVCLPERYIEDFHVWPMYYTDWQFLNLQRCRGCLEYLACFQCE